MFAYVLWLAGLGEDPLGHCYSQKNLSLACLLVLDCKPLPDLGLLHRHPLPATQGMSSGWFSPASSSLGVGWRDLSQRGAMVGDGEVASSPGLPASLPR